MCVSNIKYYLISGAMEAPIGFRNSASFLRKKTINGLWFIGRKLIRPDHIEMLSNILVLYLVPIECPWGGGTFMPREQVLLIVQFFIVLVDLLGINLARAKLWFLID
jgi:hypothetical protein